MGMLLRRAGIALAVACGLWWVAAIAYVYAPHYLDFARGWPDPLKWGDAWGGGLLITLVGFPLGLWLAVAGARRAREELWTSDRRRGTVIVSDMRPGRSEALLVAGVGGVLAIAQELTCSLDVRVADVPVTRADYIGAVGPLDAQRFVEGATLACEAAASVPDRIRIWPHADPKVGELQGRFLDFRPA